MEPFSHLADHSATPRDVDAANPAIALYGDDALGEVGVLVVRPSRPPDDLASAVEKAGGLGVGAIVDLRGALARMAGDPPCVVELGAAGTVLSDRRCLLVAPNAGRDARRPGVRLPHAVEGSVAIRSPSDLATDHRPGAADMRPVEQLAEHHPRVGRSSSPPRVCGSVPPSPASDQRSLREPAWLVRLPSLRGKVRLE